MFSRFHSFPEKLAVILKCVWAFFALTITAYEAEGFLDSVIVLLCLFVPVLSLEAMRWLFSLKRMPVWTFFLFLPLMSLTFIPLTHELREETIWMLSVVEPVCFYVLRFINNKIHGHNSLLDDLSLIQELYKKTPKVIKKSVAVALLITAILLPFSGKINLIRIDMKVQKQGVDSLSIDELWAWRQAQQLGNNKNPDHVSEEMYPELPDANTESRAGPVDKTDRFDELFAALESDRQQSSPTADQKKASISSSERIASEIREIQKSLPKIIEENIVLDYIKTDEDKIEYQFLVHGDGVEKISIDESRFNRAAIDKAVTTDFCEDEFIKLANGKGYALQWVYRDITNGALIRTINLAPHVCPDLLNYEKCGQIHFKRAFQGDHALTKEEVLILKNECRSN